MTTTEEYGMITKLVLGLAAAIAAVFGLPVALRSAEEKAQRLELDGEL